MSKSRVLDTADDLWQMMDAYNSLGYAGSIPVLSANGIFWMAYPYEDGDQIYVGMECGDPREHFEYDDGEPFYPVLTCNDSIIIYPLEVLWTPTKSQIRIIE